MKIALRLMAAAVFLVSPLPAAAIPYFAHEYELTCQKCHGVIPRLNDFGQTFLDHDYQLTGMSARSAFPLSAKANFAYSSEPDPAGLPKAIVDELEFFLAGTPTPRTSYFLEQYIVDGGKPGSTRDAWIAQRFTPDAAKVPVYLQAGSFTLPLPVDPEMFRESNAHYAVFDQTVGANPFNFFEPKIGLHARAGFADRGLSLHLLALQGHDKQSGLSTLGLDTMAYVQQSFARLALSLYHYDGSRPDGGQIDRFWRMGYGVVYTAGRWESDTVLQIGHDTRLNGVARAASSGGGFTQLRYAFDRRLFCVVRYEGTSDPDAGVTRDLVPVLGYRVSRNSRLTAEDVLSHAPATKNTLNLQYTVAY